MLSEFEYSKHFLKQDNILICPICKESLSIKGHSLICKKTY